MDIITQLVAGGVLDRNPNGFEDGICAELAGADWPYDEGSAASCDRALALYPEDGVTWTIAARWMCRATGWN